jgi:hypothetical protein
MVRWSPKIAWNMLETTDQLVRSKAPRTECQYYGIKCRQPLSEQLMLDEKVIVDGPIVL